MKKIIFILIVLWCGIGVAFSKGNVNAGQTKVGTCSVCHGINGISLIPRYPNLAGQWERYLIKQITEIKTGDRIVSDMTPFVKDLNAKDIENISAFYASQSAAYGVADPKLVELGEQLYRFGKQDVGIPPCSACHSPTGKGNSLAGFPRISGQHAQYIAKQLRNFREGDRHNDGSKIMRMIVERLNNTEVDALASYISGLR